MLEGTRLASVDPGDAQWNGFGPDKVLGCVVYPAAEVVEPGLIKHIEGNRFSLGEPDGSKSDRAVALSKALMSAGLKAPVRPKLRDEIWVKLWGNLSFNPISALTHATLDVLCTDPGTREVARGMMVEAQEIAEKLGVKFPIDVERRIDGGAAVGAHRTSMWQDLDQGRPMEIDALVKSVQELGVLTKTATPTIATVLALIQLRAKTAGWYNPYQSALRASGVPVIALDDDRERAMQVVEAEIRTAIRQDFINSVVLGCAGMVHMTDNRGDTSFKLIDGVEAAVCFVRML